MKIVSVIGTRPQFIKCAAMTRELRKEHHEIIVNTGQHYDSDLSSVFFEQLDIPTPEYNLGIGSGTHAYQIGHTMIAVEEILAEEKPGLVMVYGDTNTTLAGALAASKLHIPIGHIEAGVRSWDRNQPEETNRVLTDHCSDLLFCPTKSSMDNLIKENVTKGVHLTGDVMVDILLHLLGVAEMQSTILDDLNLQNKDYFVVTVHRPDNTDIPENLNNIIEALIQIDRKIIFPVHPRTIDALDKHGLREKLSSTDNIQIVKPLAYLDLLKLMNHADKIITDSGGIEKEAYVLKVPCITMLETTPWPETAEDGWNAVVGSDTEKILKMARNFHPSGERSEDYGKGEACRNIRNIIATMSG